MKRILSLIVILVLFPCLSLGEEAKDYSWLDDMTINQLKELDAEIHKRIPAANESPEETADADSLLDLLFGGSAGQEKSVEPQEVKIGDTITTDFATVELLGHTYMGQPGSPSGFSTITGGNAEEKFYLDSDCGVYALNYRVTNNGTVSKWFWPSSLKIRIHWNDYVFESGTNQPMGDLQVTQTKDYLGVVQIPNNILAEGCDNITIELGFNTNFKTISNLDNADFRYVIYDGYEWNPSGTGSITEFPVPGSLHVTNGVKNR